MTCLGLRVWPVVLAAVLLAGAAHAAPTTAEKETARSLLDDGDRRMSAKDYASALTAYRAADELVHAPTTAIEVGHALEALGQWLEARDEYILVAHLPSAPGESPAFARARQDADQALRALEARIPTLAVAIPPVDPSAHIHARVDGFELPEAAARLARRTNPGAHVILVKVDGFREARTEVTVKEREQRSVDVVLEREAAPAPVVVPMAPGPVAAPPVVAAAPPPPGRQGEGTASSNSAAWVVLGVGAAGLIVGGISGAIAFADESSARGQCTGSACRPAAQGDIDASKTAGDVSTTAFVVGGAAVLTGAVLYFVRGKHGAAPAPATSTQLLLGPGSVGLAGAF